MNGDGRIVFDELNLFQIQCLRTISCRVIDWRSCCVRLVCRTKLSIYNVSFPLVTSSSRSTSQTGRSNYLSHDDLILDQVFSRVDANRTRHQRKLAAHLAEMYSPSLQLHQWRFLLPQNTDSCSKKCRPCMSRVWYYILIYNSLHNAIFVNSAFLLHLCVTLTLTQILQLV